MTRASRVVVYARCSAIREAEPSIAEQVRLCRERAAREGWYATEEFRDVGPSAATGSRKALDAMLARAPYFDLVIAETPDRLCRDRGNLEAFRKQLAAEGCGLVTVSEETTGGHLERL